MKKICVLTLIQLAFATACYGAVSEDVYVRKDVFEANMQGINTKLDILLEQMKEFKAEMKEQREEMKTLREEHKAQIKELQDEMKAMRADIAELTRVVSVLSERVDRNFETLSARIDGVEGQISGLRNGIYLGLVVLGIVLGMPAVQKMFQSWAERVKRPSLTVEDVKRLIDEALSNRAVSSSGN